jgi:glutamate carboxypeptidase
VTGPIDASAAAIARSVRAQIGDRLPDLLRDTATLVAMDSPSLNAPLLDATAEAVADLSLGLGLNAELLPGKGDGAYARSWIQGAGRHNVLLLCHHDTVFPAGTTAGWQFRVDGDRMHGPGVIDMKGGIVLGLHTMAALAMFPDAYRSVTLLSVPDEEVRHGPPLYVQDGITHLVLTLECGRENGDIVTARKAGAWLEINITGLAAHAGVDPDAGRNAALAAAAEATRIASLHRSKPGLSVTVTGLNSGVGMNTVPPGASVTVDIRALLERDMDAVISQIDSRPPSDLDISRRTLARTPAMERTPSTARLAALARAAARMLDYPADEQTTGGSSDACWAAAAGYPTLDGLGPVGGRDHTREEYGLISSLAPRSGILAALVAGGPAATTSDHQRPPATSQRPARVR